MLEVWIYYVGLGWFLLKTNPYLLCPNKIQFEFWKPWKRFTPKLVLHKDMLYTHQCLPEQKLNSKQEKTIYGKKLLTFEKCDRKKSYID